MTTFRFSGLLLLGLALAGCDKNMPAPQTELGRIARIGDVEETKRELQAFAESRFGDSGRLVRELTTAGFRKSTDPSDKCDYFHWTGRQSGSLFDKTMIIGVCADGVTVNAGYRGP